MLATGMRTQELLALEPRHIKEDGSRIVIEQALKRVKGSVDIGPPKSQDSFRTIPVPVSVRHCARFLAATDTMFIWEGKYKDKPCNPTHFADLYKKALTEIEGMRYLSPHCCRHTYVSQMQALGVDLATIQSIVGHADIDMTKHYLHVQESIRQAAIEKFSEAFMVEEEQMGNSLLIYGRRILRLYVRQEFHLKISRLQEFAPNVTAAIFIHTVKWVIKQADLVL